MPIRFVLDENQRGQLWQAIQDHNRRGGDPIDAVRVGDPPDLPLGINDSALLVWAEQADRMLVTADKETMIAELGDHLAAGRHSPGVFLIRRRSHLRDLVAFLTLVAGDDGEGQWRDRIIFIP
jgi:hypothetical protein